jgi:hypothetical protein
MPPQLEAPGVYAGARGRYHTRGALPIDDLGHSLSTFALGPLLLAQGLLVTHGTPV